MAGRIGDGVTGSALTYLLQRQNPDGGWNRLTGSGELDVTAHVLRALAPLRALNESVAAAVLAGNALLLSQRSADGLWSEDFLSALALIALTATTTDLSALGESANALSARQLADGSWSEDTYTTALALRALAQYAARAGAGTGRSGTVSGYVYLAGTSEPLMNAQVVLSSQSYAFTNSKGFFTLSGVPAGTQTLTARKAGYSATAKSVAVQEGQSHDAGAFHLTPNSDSGFVQGAVYNALDKHGIAGATVKLSGALSYQITTASDGSFDLGSVVPGSYTVGVSSAGYRALSGQITVAAGTLTSIRQGLTPDDVYPDESPVDVSGRVVNGSTGEPIADVEIQLDDRVASSTADGTFLFGSVARGDHRLELRRQGFDTRVYTFNLPPGAAGDLGELQLYASTGEQAPTTLTLKGTVIDALSNEPIAGATATLAANGATRTSDAAGGVVFSGLTALSQSITVSAAGHETRTFQITASGYGEISLPLPLPPAGGNDSATETTLTGTVTDADTGEKLADATVTVVGHSLSATTDAEGAFEIAGIDVLQFTLAVAATGYEARSYGVQLTRHGSYSVDLELAPPAYANRFRIESLVPEQTATGANTIQTFAATIANLTDIPQSALVLADIVDPAGIVVGTVTPYAPGTQTPTAEVAFQEEERIDLVIPWDTAQAPAGTYRVLLRLVVPESITRDLPSGLIMAEAETTATVVGTSAIKGELGLQPPLAQAGTSQPVALTAIVINSGNVPLSGLPLTLSIRTPDGSGLLHSVDAVVDAIEIGNNVLVDFGEWVPTTAGDLPVSVASSDGSAEGSVNGTLYVGDKATGAFTVDRSVVPLGTQTVRGTVSLQGVDTRTGISTDPLFLAVREAVRKGGEYVAPAAQQWKNSNLCLGCHIQTQSLLGLNAAVEKVEIDERAIQFLYNDIAGSLRADGALRVSHPEHTKVQTALGMWSLSDWRDSRQVFRTMYRATEHMLARVNTSGAQSWWTPDHGSLWWSNNDAMNMATVRGMSALLRHADVLGSTPVDDFVLEDAYNVGITNLMDFEQGPDGWMYYVDVNGVAYARNLATGQVRTVAGGMPNPSYGLAVRDDGVVFVSSRARLTRINTDGTKTTLLSGSSYGDLTDVVIGADGTLYVADSTKHRIWRVSPTGQVSTLAAGGLLSKPYGLAVDADGSLLVANYNRYNILRITLSGAVSKFADGLPYRPNWIKRTPDGELYVLHERIYLGNWIPVGVWRIDENGFAERVAEVSSQNSYNLNGLGVIDGQVYVGHAGSKRIHRLRKRALDTSKLATVRQTLPWVARYELNRHKDGTSDNLIQSWRLITLGEVLAHTTDPALRSELETAMSYIANVLRQRQRGDGGWGRIVGWGSDPLVTAAVGLALEYTNPSVNDPLVRKTITYLLNKQNSDKSWSSPNGVFTTRLGATSFVMAYLPLALDRLGGIDVDLNIVMPANVQLSNPSQAPTSAQPTADGGMAYHWFMQGVTARTRDIQFDLQLDDMAYQERRPVASEAWLGFRNSFTEEELRADLPIPEVRAVSDLALAVSTDRTSYPASHPVAISSRVDNVGPAVSYGNVDLYIRLPGTEDVVADLGRHGFGALEQGGWLALSSGWNTGTLPAGEYELYGRLFDQTERLADEATALFSIVHPEPTLVAAVMTDRPVYQAWDDVALTSRVQNPTSNATQPPSLAQLTVKTPDGVIIHDATYEVAELAAGSQLTFPDTLRLSDAASGEYPVDLVVRDELTREVVAISSTHFVVERGALQGITGTVSVEHTQVYQGDPNLCTDEVSNRSASPLTGVTIVRRLVSLDSSEEIAASEQLQDFSGNQQLVWTRTIDTEPLAVGNYACLLAAKLDGRTVDLGSAGFAVLEPPIRIEASLSLGSRGRVLVLLDGEAPPASIAQTEPSYEAQRSYLEALLTREGWSYTIVTDSDAFAWELRTGDYSIYALFAEHAKLDEQVQKELREAVYRGEGLVDAGEHDQRHQKFDEALGIKHIGKHSDAVGVDLAESELMPADYAELTLKDKALRATLTTAQALGSYVGPTAETMAAAGLDHGRGRSVYLGFDLLAEAALAGESSVHEQLIVRALTYVEPELAPPGAGQLVPLRVSIDNEGIATPGRALLEVPAGAFVVDRGEAELADGALIWTFDLQEEQSLDFTVWLRLPDAQTVAFDLLVQSGLDPEFEDQATAALEVALDARPGLSEAQALAASSNDFRQVVNWLDKAASALAAGNPEAAIGDLVKAADELIKDMSKPRAGELRLMIDQALVQAGRQL
ncbi:MAG: carboxypeptidase regulatory-like domain-containing protein [Pseudomonadota bacterium]